MKEQRKFWFLFFPVGDSQKSKRVFWEVRGFGESRDLLLSPSRSDLVVQSCFCFFVYQIARSRSWAWFQGLFCKKWLKNEGTKSDFHTFGVNKTNKKNKKLTNWWNLSNLGPQSSKWYQNDRQGRRGYFRKCWAWTTLKKPNKSKCPYGFSSKRAESTDKRLGPIWTSAPRCRTHRLRAGSGTRRRAAAIAQCAGAWRPVRRCGERPDKCWTPRPPLS